MTTKSANVPAKAYSSEETISVKAFSSEDTPDNEEAKTNKQRKRGADLSNLDNSYNYGPPQKVINKYY
jgi:hypothetical protein